MRHLFFYGSTTFQCFNPRTRKGCDNSYRNNMIDNFSFNPRTRKGCDLTTGGKQLTTGGFNPRTRKGCDSKAMYFIIIKTVSIHAPVKDATRRKWLFKLIIIWFQSTHP